MDKQLVNFITCGCESSAPFYNLQSRARTHAVTILFKPFDFLSRKDDFYIIWFLNILLWGYLMKVVPDEADEGRT
jgi:hypothetical protein